MNRPAGAARPEPQDGLLTPAEEATVRELVAEAVLATPQDLRAELEHDPTAYLRLVAASRVAAEESSRLLREAIAGARGAGHSWDTLGRLLGVSRQAAQQRFGTPSEASPEVTADGPAQRVLRPLTAFDEMAVLKVEGRHGWHVIGFGPLYHLVEASPWQWEHRRVPFGAPRRRLETEGWQQVPGATFPWAYYKRRLDLPAL
ncbi:hypothetical protein [Dactylosporangium salmoneum]|uniref:Uncharacterized protein n=1 Tax=Dactylosporangium salmoneum TaxID=53361 RepID=A0ABP5U3N8_9ACTN